MKAEQAAVITRKGHIIGSGTRLEGRGTNAHGIPLCIPNLVGFGPRLPNKCEQTGGEGEKSWQPAAIPAAIRCRHQLVFLLQKLQHIPELGLVDLVSDKTSGNTDHQQHGS